MTDEAAFTVVFIGWVALGVGGWLLMRGRHTAGEKRSAHRTITIAGGAIFAAFSIWAAPPAAVMIIPMVAVIIWLNLRNTLFCARCGETSQIARPLAKRAAFCPICGAPCRTEKFPD
jgi:cytochrome bd-type quinol oxidase subunit 2